jgi:hypothetical protein
LTGWILGVCGALSRHDFHYSGVIDSVCDISS